MVTDYLSGPVLDTVLDSLRLLPFLFLTYLLMEFLEHHSGGKTEALIRRSGRLGPLVGGLLGIVPQCGFSAAAASLYAGRIITVGTLFAVFLSTSDEMLPIMLSGLADGSVKLTVLLKILAVKLVCGIIVGFIVDLLMRKSRTDDDGSIGEICEHERCNCKNGIFVSALTHTLKIMLFIFFVTLAVNTVVFFVGEDRIGSVMHGIPVVGELIAGLIGLIPNCAASVVITELYIEGTITAGQLLAGLFTGAGVGVLILFRTNRRLKENLLILAGLYISGVLLGLLIGMTGISGILNI